MIKYDRVQINFNEFSDPYDEYKDNPLVQRINDKKSRIHPLCFPVSYFDSLKVRMGMIGIDKVEDNEADEAFAVEKLYADKISLSLSFGEKISFLPPSRPDHEYEKEKEREEVAFLLHEYGIKSIVFFDTYKKTQATEISLDNFVSPKESHVNRILLDFVGDDLTLSVSLEESKKDF